MTVVAERMDLLNQRSVNISVSVSISVSVNVSVSVRELGAKIGTATATVSMEVLLRIRPTFRFEQVGISGGRLRTLLPCLEVRSRSDQWSTM